MNIAGLYNFSAPGQYMVKLSQPMDGHLKYVDQKIVYVTVEGNQEMVQILQSRRDAFWSRHESDTRIGSFMQTNMKSST